MKALLLATIIFQLVFSPLADTYARSRGMANYAIKREQDQLVRWMASRSKQIDSLQARLKEAINKVKGKKEKTIEDHNTIIYFNKIHPNGVELNEYFKVLANIHARVNRLLPMYSELDDQLKLIHFYLNKIIRPWRRLMVMYLFQENFDDYSIKETVEVLLPDLILTQEQAQDKEVQRKLLVYLNGISDNDYQLMKDMGQIGQGRNGAEEDDETFIDKYRRQLDGRYSRAIKAQDKTIEEAQKGESPGDSESDGDEKTFEPFGQYKDINGEKIHYLAAMDVFAFFQVQQNDDDDGHHLVFDAIHTMASDIIALKLVPSEYTMMLATQWMTEYTLLATIDKFEYFAGTPKGMHIPKSCSVEGDGVLPTYWNNNSFMAGESKSGIDERMETMDQFLVSLGLVPDMEAESASDFEQAYLNKQNLDPHNPGFTATLAFERHYNAKHALAQITDPDSYRSHFPVSFNEDGTANYTVRKNTHPAVTYTGIDDLTDFRAVTDTVMGDLLKGHWLGPKDEGEAVLWLLGIKKRQNNCPITIGEQNQFIDQIIAKIIDIESPEDEERPSPENELKDGESLVTSLWDTNKGPGFTEFGKQKVQNFSTGVSKYVVERMERLGVETWQEATVDEVKEQLQNNHLAFSFPPLYGSMDWKRLGFRAMGAVLQDIRDNSWSSAHSQAQKACREFSKYTQTPSACLDSRSDSSKVASAEVILANLQRALEPYTDEGEQIPNTRALSSEAMRNFELIAYIWNANQKREYFRRRMGQNEWDSMHGQITANNPWPSIRLGYLLAVHDLENSVAHAGDSNENDCLAEGLGMLKKFGQSLGLDLPYHHHHMDRILNREQKIKVLTKIIDDLDKKNYGAMKLNYSMRDTTTLAFDNYYQRSIREGLPTYGQVTKDYHSRKFEAQNADKDLPSYYDRMRIISDSTILNRHAYNKAQRQADITLDDDWEALGNEVEDSILYEQGNLFMELWKNRGSSPAQMARQREIAARLANTFQDDIAQGRTVKGSLLYLDDAFKRPLYYQSLQDMAKQKLALLKTDFLNICKRRPDIKNRTKTFGLGETGENVLNFKMLYRYSLRAQEALKEQYELENGGKLPEDIEKVFTSLKDMNKELQTEDEHYEALYGLAHAGLLMGGIMLMTVSSGPLSYLGLIWAASAGVSVLYYQREVILMSLRDPRNHDRARAVLQNAVDNNLLSQEEVDDLTRSRAWFYLELLMSFPVIGAMVQAGFMTVRIPTAFGKGQFFKLYETYWSTNGRLAVRLKQQYKEATRDHRQLLADVKRSNKYYSRRMQNNHDNTNSIQSLLEASKMAVRNSNKALTKLAKRHASRQAKKEQKLLEVREAMWEDIRATPTVYHLMMSSYQMGHSRVHLPKVNSANPLRLIFDQEDLPYNLTKEQWKNLLTAIKKEPLLFFSNAARKRLATLAQRAGNLGQQILKNDDFRLMFKRMDLDETLENINRGFGHSVAGFFRNDPRPITRILEWYRDNKLEVAKRKYEDLSELTTPKALAARNWFARQGAGFKARPFRTGMAQNVMDSLEQIPWLIGKLEELERKGGNLAKFIEDNATLFTHVLMNFPNRWKREGPYMVLSAGAAMVTPVARLKRFLFFGETVDRSMRAPFVHVMTDGVLLRRFATSRNMLITELERLKAQRYFNPKANTVGAMKYTRKIIAFDETIRRIANGIHPSDWEKYNELITKNLGRLHEGIARAVFHEVQKLKKSPLQGLANAWKAKDGKNMAGYFVKVVLESASSAFSNILQFRRLRTLKGWDDEEAFVRHYTRQLQQGDYRLMQSFIDSVDKRLMGEKLFPEDLKFATRIKEHATRAAVKQWRQEGELTKDQLVKKIREFSQELNDDTRKVIKFAEDKYRDYPVEEFARKMEAVHSYDLKRTAASTGAAAMEILAKRRGTTENMELQWNLFRQLIDMRIESRTLENF